MRGGLSLALAGALAASMSCKVNGVFQCADDTQCTGQGVSGTCEGNGLCSFADGTCDSGRRYGELAGDLSGECVGADGPSDAATDDGGPPDAISSCEPGERICAGRTLGTCNASGTGLDPSLDVVCDFTCDSDHCVLASNVTVEFAASCSNTAPVLAPPAGATVAIDRTGPDVQITCAPDCGDGTTTQIDAVDVGGAISAFCLSRLELASGIQLAPVQNIDDSLLFLVDGDAIVDGSIGIAGTDAQNATSGTGGPGGGGGAPIAGGPGITGGGSCGGAGGQRAGPGNNQAGGGGGGGGHGGLGGTGGAGRSPDGDSTADGGVGGSLCGDPSLIPLVGGSGGGSGASATCDIGSSCGWPGGGGGGAIQISSRTRVSITGSIAASGGDGEGFTIGGESVGGGGGGGAGGAILLEAPVVAIAGTLEVDGGTGGAGGGGTGGSGASGGVISGANGSSFATDGDGGAGGGGGGGRVHVKAILPVCANVSPGAVCTTAALAAAP